MPPPPEKEKREYTVDDLTKEDAAYIGEKINEIVPREVDADEEEFVLKVENENGEIIGGCIAEAYEYHWSRLLLGELWVDERYRHQGIGSKIIREVERIAREKGCRVVTLGTASYMARPFYEKHGYTGFTTLKRQTAISIIHWSNTLTVRGKMILPPHGKMRKEKKLCKPICKY